MKGSEKCQKTRMRCFELALIRNLECADRIQMFLVPREYLEQAWSKENCFECGHRTPHLHFYHYGV